MATIRVRPIIPFRILMAGVGMDPIPMVGMVRGDGIMVAAIVVQSLMGAAALMAVALMVVMVAAGDKVVGTETKALRHVAIRFVRSGSRPSISAMSD
jgi:hypothetical protein